MLGSDRNSLQSFSHKQDLLAKKKKKAIAVEIRELESDHGQLTPAPEKAGPRETRAGCVVSAPLPLGGPRPRARAPAAPPTRAGRASRARLPPKRPPLAGGRRLVCLLPLPQQRSSKPDSGTRGKPPRASRRESPVRPAPSLTRTRDRNEGGRPPPLPAVRAAAAG